MFDLDDFGDLISKRTDFQPRKGQGHDLYCVPCQADFIYSGKNILPQTQPRPDGRRTVRVCHVCTRDLCRTGKAHRLKCLRCGQSMLVCPSIGAPKHVKRTTEDL